MINKRISARVRISFVGSALLLILTACSGSGGAANPTVVPSATTSAAQAVPTATEAAATATANTAPTATEAVPTQAAPTASAAPEASEPDVAAVSVLIDYYQNIEGKRYSEAYALWEGNGGASGQTLEQFTTGYTNTVEVDVRLGTPQETGGTVVVPANVISISNDPASANGDQAVQQFAGSYTLAPSSDGRWLIKSAQIAPTTGSLPPADLADAAQVINDYYSAINSGELPRAYTYWGHNGADSQQSFAEFAAGFADTQGVQVILGNATTDAGAGSLYASVPVVIIATKQGATQDYFCGTYQLRRLNIPPFDQLGWHIEQATVRSTAPVQPASNEMQALLNGGCK